MPRKKLPWTFERLRHLAFLRHRAQAIFRGEDYQITEDYWNMIWTEDRFRQRGMKAENLCLTRRNHSRPWAPGNLCLLRRQFQLEINNKVIHAIPVDHIYTRSIWSDYE